MTIAPAAAELAEDAALPAAEVADFAPAPAAEVAEDAAPPADEAPLPTTPKRVVFLPFAVSVEVETAEPEPVMVPVMRLVDPPAPPATP